MKRLFVLVLLALAAAPTFAVDVAFAALFNYDLVQKDGSLLLDRKKVSDLAYAGIVVDVPLSESQGVFVQTAVRFEDVTQGARPGGYNKNIHWDANVLGVYHPLSYDTFVDPFVTYGVGTSGGQFFDDRANDWRTRTQIVLFPEVGAGVNLRFGGFVVGTNLRAQILSFNPSPLKTYHQFPVALTLDAGWIL